MYTNEKRKKQNRIVKIPLQSIHPIDSTSILLENTYMNCFF